MSEASKPAGPDLAQGIPLSDLPDGAARLGHVGDEAVLLVRRGDEIFAVGASCTHYGGPLAEGLIVGDTVRCPLHHACFSLRTRGALAALAAPPLEPIACWSVEKRGSKLVVLGKKARSPAPADTSKHPSSVVIVG